MSYVIHNTAGLGWPFWGTAALSQRRLLAGLCRPQLRTTTPPKNHQSCTAPHTELLLASPRQPAQQKASAELGNQKVLPTPPSQPGRRRNYSTADDQRAGDWKPRWFPLAAAQVLPACGVSAVLAQHFWTLAGVFGVTEIPFTSYTKAVRQNVAEEGCQNTLCGL